MADILVIDDEVGMRSSIERILRNAGHRVLLPKMDASASSSSLNIVPNSW